MTRLSDSLDLSTPGLPPFGRRIRLRLDKLRKFASETIPNSATGSEGMFADDSVDLRPVVVERIMKRRAAPDDGRKGVAARRYTETLPRVSDGDGGGEFIRAERYVRTLYIARGAGSPLTHVTIMSRAAARHARSTTTVLEEIVISYERSHA
jgi:hypothetical protein